MPGVLVDADILIDVLRGDTSAVARIDRAAAGGARHISVLTAAELRAGGGGDHPAVDLLLRAFQTLPLELRTAEEGGRLRRRFGRSHGTGLIDAILAATALEHDLVLVTGNRRHYRVPGLALA